MTTEQYLDLPSQCDANGNSIKDELVAGELVLVPLSFRVHDVVKNEIWKFLIDYLETHEHLELETLIGMGFAVTDRDSVTPDVCVIEKLRLLDRNQRILTGAPEIAIEVVSPSDTVVRLEHKIRAYLANGANSVWIVYPDDKSIDVNTNHGIREFSGNESIEDDTLLGFSQSVAAFFEGL